MGTAFASANYFVEHVTLVRIADISKEWMIQRTIYEEVRYHCNACRDSTMEKLGGYTMMELEDHFMCAYVVSLIL